MALQTVVAVTRAGFDLATLAAADALGDTFVNTGKEYVIVKNGGGGSINVQPHLTPTLDGQTATDPSIAVAAGATKIIGPFPVGLYNDTNNLCKINYSGVTSVTMKVVQCPPA